MSRIVLNVLPPTNNQMPSIAVEVLKTFLVERKYEVDVVYWNHIFSDLTKLSDIDGKVESNIQYTDTHILLPFLAYFAKEYGDLTIKNRILIELQSIYPFFKNLGKDYYEQKFEKFIAIIEERFSRLIEEILNKKDILLFGISAKFDAWIPGIILAKKIKEKRPEIKCVIGGFENKIAAETIFNNFEVFDYAIYGEGEGPLLKLAESLELEKEKQKYDFEIPRLLTRSSESEMIAIEDDNEDSYVNLSDIGFLNYSEFIDSYKTYIQADVRKITFPIETSRSCRWGKCNFCALNWGYLYRTKNLKYVVDEILYYFKEFGVNEFFFVDNDIVGKNKGVFEDFLDMLIKMIENTSSSFSFHADILHLGFEKKLVKKMSLAGFKSVQIGYEAISDGMLKKLKKATTFADNILFVKFSQQFDIELTITGLIIGLPNESEEDVLESCKNLHYLRFFLKNDNRRGLKHNFAELMLFYDTPFWNMMTQEERQEFNQHPTTELLPKDFLPFSDEFYSIFGQIKKQPTNMSFWRKFDVVSTYYERTDFKYYLIKNDKDVHYIEYKNNLKIEDITFDDIVYIEILKYANNKVVSLDYIFEKVSLLDEALTKNKVIDVVNQLRDKYLLYANKSYSKIVSVINTDLIS